jgi:hydrogenase maturation protease
MKALVVGIGNREGGDGAAGIEVVRRLRAMAPLDADLRKCADATRLLDWWRGYEEVVIVDTVAGDRPGRVHRFEAHRHPVPVLLRSSSIHHWGPAEAVELARAVNRLPARVIVFAIESSAFTSGSPPSPAVESAIASVVQSVRQELRRPMVSAS